MRARADATASACQFAQCQLFGNCLGPSVYFVCPIATIACPRRFGLMSCPGDSEPGLRRRFAPEDPGAGRQFPVVVPSSFPDLSNPHFPRTPPATRLRPAHCRRPHCPAPPKAARQQTDCFHPRSDFVRENKRPFASATVPTTGRGRSHSHQAARASSQRPARCRRARYHRPSLPDIPPLADSPQKHDNHWCIRVGSNEMALSPIGWPALRR